MFLCKTRGNGGIEPSLPLRCNNAVALVEQLHVEQRQPCSNRQTRLSPRKQCSQIP
jgi:hypothetical protein